MPPVPENTISTGSFISFCPNPFITTGYLLYYHDKHILNIIIVDSKYNKLCRYRLTDRQQVVFDFTTLNKGIYRLYYVIQDSQYNIVHLGHGDIEKL